VISETHDTQHAKDVIARNPEIPLDILRDHPHKKWTADAMNYLQKQIDSALVPVSAVSAPVQENTVAVVVAEPTQDEPANIESETSSTVVAESTADSAATDTEPTDEEITADAAKFYKQTDRFSEAVKLLLDEYSGITSEEAKDFVGRAMEDIVEDEKSYADEKVLAAAQARDKELAAQAEADRLFLENYGYKHRKRIKVSPGDEEKAAKLYREKAREEQAGPNVRIRRLDFTKKKKLYWLWQHRVPFGAISTLAGDPDQGKSLISLYLAARVSCGQKLYGNTEDTEAGEVLMLCAEDDPEITLRPRLEAAGADLQKIHLLESVLLKDGAGKTSGERLAQLDTDIQAIERVLNDNPDIKLVIIDPISSFLGSANMNREQEVRKALQPLATRARTFGLAVVMVAHFNKNSETRSAMDRVGGAKALVSMGRAAWVCVPQPKKEPQPGQPMEIQDPDRRLFLKLKGNLAPSKIGGLMYTIKTAPVEVEDKDGRPVMEPHPFIVWLGETQDTAQDVVIEGRSSQRVTVTNKVKDWLQTYIRTAGGYAPSDVILRTAKVLGYSERTVHRARGELKLQTHWAGHRTLWAFEGVEIPAPPPLLDEIGP
jgi:putative DNA primase/helicase